MFWNNRKICQTAVIANPMPLLPRSQDSDYILFCSKFQDTLFVHYSLQKVDTPKHDPKFQNNSKVVTRKRRSTFES